MAWVTAIKRLLMAVSEPRLFAILPQSPLKEVIMVGLDRLIPLTKELNAQGIGEDDFDLDPARPPTTIVGVTRYVEATRWDGFKRVLMARACFARGGLAPDEMPPWCRPGAPMAADQRGLAEISEP
jgi:hypothetical protein